MNSPLLQYDLGERFRLNLRDLYFYIKSHLMPYEKGMAILNLSFPKSGTHLLSSILSKVPGIYYWNDIISVQSLSGVMNSLNHIKWKLSSIPPNSLLRGHLIYCDEILELFSSFKHRRIFIYRDLRDVAISNANWVMKEPRFYLHNYYKKYLNTEEERIMASIEGIPPGTPIGSNVSVPDIGTDFTRYQDWINDESTFSLKFEDLVGERGGGCENKRIDLICDLMNFLSLKFTRDYISNHFSSSNPILISSHTFKKGQGGMIGKWKNKFSESHKEIFKKYAGDLLIELGYENNLSW
jgi:hypothetical protein